MGSRTVAKISLALAIMMLVISVVGFVITLVVNAFFLDKYDAYGEVAVPGSGVVHLPAGETTVSLHALVIGSSDGGLPVPPLNLSITPPAGAPKPEITESIGSSTTINNDAHIRVFKVQIGAEGDYKVQTDGQTGGYINPRLAFGHSGSSGYLVWVFVGLFVFSLIDLVVSIVWLARTRRRAVPSMGGPFYTSYPGGPGEPPPLY